MPVDLDALMAQHATPTVQAALAASPKQLPLPTPTPQAITLPRWQHPVRPTQPPTHHMDDRTPCCLSYPGTENDSLICRACKAPNPSLVSVPMQPPHYFDALCYSTVPCRGGWAAVRVEHPERHDNLLIRDDARLLASKLAKACADGGSPSQWYDLTAHPSTEADWRDEGREPDVEPGPVMPETKLTSYQECKGRDGHAYSCRLIVDGKRAAEVSQGGHGACNSYYPVDQKSLRVVTKWAEAVYGQIEPLDSHVYMLADEIVQRKRYLRMCRGKVLFRHAGESYAEGEWGTLKLAWKRDKQRALDYLARYDDVVILNDLLDRKAEIPA